MKFSFLTSTGAPRILHFALIFGLSGVLLALFLGPSSCHHPEPPEGIDGAFSLQSLVPSDADAVLYAPHFSDLHLLLQGLQERLPQSTTSLESAEHWQQLGVSLQAPAVAFIAQGQLVISAWIDPETGATLENAFPLLAERIHHPPPIRRGSGWREVDAQGRWQRWFSTDGYRLSAGFPIQDDAAPLDDRIWEISTPRPLSPTFQEFAEEDPSAPLQGSLHAASLLRRLPGDARAGLLRDQLATSLGDLHFRVHLPPEGDALQIELYTPGSQAAPLSFDLGRARGPLPDIGGLARPGVLGILRLSADPQALFAMIQALLPPETRQDLQSLLHTLREELLVDVEGEILENLTGQFAIIFYGIEDSFFEATGLELFSSLVRLESTREALLIPISDRPRLEEYLNIFTQLSRGRLRRQVIRHTVQYAWFEEGALNWAMILNDDYLLFVDSAVAFDHASSWERNPTHLATSLKARGVAEIMTADRGLATYLDLSILRSILQSGDRLEAARWLEFADALRIQTDHQDRPDRTEIKLWFSRPFSPGDHIDPPSDSPATP